MNKKKFKTVSLPAREYELAEQLAKKQMRSLSNYLQVLINKEYEAVKIIVVLALLLFASCAREEIGTPLNDNCKNCDFKVYYMNNLDSLTWYHFPNEDEYDVQVCDDYPLDTSFIYTEWMPHYLQAKLVVRTCELID